MGRGNSGVDNSESTTRVQLCQDPDSYDPLSALGRQGARARERASQCAGRKDAGGSWNHHPLQHHQTTVRGAGHRDHVQWADLDTRADRGWRRYADSISLQLAPEPARAGAPLTMAASIAHTSAPTHHHYTTLGLDSRKVAIWAFIGSECMLFVSLISAYLIYKGRSIVGPFHPESWTDPATGQVLKPILNIPVTSASTFVLLMSSLFMVLALAAVQNTELPKRTRGERILGTSKLWSFMTALAATTFPGFQAFAFTSF